MQIINPPSASGTSISVLKTGNNRFNNFMNVASYGTGTSLAPGAMRAAKILIPGDVTLRPSLNMDVAVAGGFITGALYFADATTGQPGLKAYDFGQWDLSVTGLIANANVAVAAGEYWFVNSVSAIVGSSQINCAVGGTTPADMSFISGAITVSLNASETYVNPLPSPNVATWSNSTGAFVSPITLSVV